MGRRPPLPLLFSPPPPRPPSSASFSSLRRLVPRYLLCDSTPVVTKVNPGTPATKSAPEVQARSQTRYFLFRDPRVRV